MHRRPWLLTLAYFVPLAGYAVWALAMSGSDQPDAARLQALLTVAGPALLTTVPAVLGVTAVLYVQAVDREDRLATRLVLLGVGGGLVARLLLGDLPQRITGDPLLPWPLLTLLIAVAVLGCVTVAIQRYRLGEIEPTVRRALVQALVLTLVGSAFVALVVAVDVASDISFGSMLAGGLVALLLLPLAVALQRALRRLVYGDRDFPHRVVSDLRHLDPMTAPEEALQETLGLLARRLRLSYAAIDVFPTASSERSPRRPGRRAAPRSPSTWWSGGAPSGDCSSRSIRAATRSVPGTVGSSRTSAARSARSSRRCRSTASCSGPASTSSPRARRNGAGSVAISTTAWAPPSPRWRCAWRPRTT